jgi:hypothetical protein
VDEEADQLLVGHDGEVEVAGADVSIGLGVVGGRDHDREERAVALAEEFEVLLGERAEGDDEDRVAAPRVGGGGRRELADQGLAGARGGDGEHVRRAVKHAGPDRLLLDVRKLGDVRRPQVD